MTSKTDNLSLVVIGASGDLAQRKIFPALFALYCQGLLPAGFRIFGFARTAFTNEQFRAKLSENLTCRHTPQDSCKKRVTAFLNRCSYIAGSYNSRDSFLDLFTEMCRVEQECNVNRIFYLAIPPSVFLDTAQAIGGAGLVNCGKEHPFSRVVIEKPFGRDRESSDLLVREMRKVFAENQTFRIDHYLGKEVIQNLMVLRFANLVFEPVWNSRYVEEVRIISKESKGIGDRGGYFDTYGILRDVVQNHLLQILALNAMERPADIGSHSVRSEKVKVLKSIPPLALRDLVLGQYKAGARNGVRNPSYTAETNVPKGSLTPTYAACVLRVNNKRWRGVPFVITAGKGLDESLSEVHIQFRKVPGNIFCDAPGCPPANHLVLRIQPDESIRLDIVNKQPGLKILPVESSLNLNYQSAFSNPIPDAYEYLLLDVIKGDRSLFIRADELAAAWDILTPVLHEMEAKKIVPQPYVFGSAGPIGGQALVEAARSARTEPKASDRTSVR